MSASKEKSMQHVHSKEHDINCIVFPQNDPGEHAAIQLRAWPTRPTLELSGQVAPPTTKRRLPTKFGRPEKNDTVYGNKHEINNINMN